MHVTTFGSNGQMKFKHTKCIIKKMNTYIGKYLENRLKLSTWSVAYENFNFHYKNLKLINHVSITMIIIATFQGDYILKKYQICIPLMTPIYQLVKACNECLLLEPYY